MKSAGKIVCFTIILYFLISVPDVFAASNPRPFEITIPITFPAPTGSTAPSPTSSPAPANPPAVTSPTQAPKQNQASPTPIPKKTHPSPTPPPEILPVTSPTPTPEASISTDATTPTPTPTGAPTPTPTPQSVASVIGSLFSNPTPTPPPAHPSIPQVNTAQNFQAYNRGAAGIVKMFLPQNFYADNKTTPAAKATLLFASVAAFLLGYKLIEKEGLSYESQRLKGQFLANRHKLSTFPLLRLLF
ncbi:MAG: hypothetical protein ACM3IJ_06385 [Candidatus Levyibacteriota bacterium]